MAKRSKSVQSQIPGWGADLPTENRPGIPREKNQKTAREAEFDQIVPQKSKGALILKSIERPRLSPVYGTTAPPIGLSGLLRRVAFRFSEGQFEHWLLLLFADRVNVFEGILLDLAHGRVPNLISEMGLKSEWQYNRPQLQKKLMWLGGGFTAALVLRNYLRRRRARPA